VVLELTVLCIGDKRLSDQRDKRAYKQ